MALLLRGRLVRRQTWWTRRGTPPAIRSVTPSSPSCWAFDPNDAPSDTDVEDYIVGVPILAEQARQADPAAWAWLTDVHETLGRLNAPPIWRTEITPASS